MALELDFELSITDCCDELQFCDTTCKFDPNKPALCCDGYGALGNPNIQDIYSTSFNWILPDGSSYNNVNPLFVQGLPAIYTLQITGGTVGNVGVAINSVYIGTTFFQTDLETTTTGLVNSINSLTAGTGWYAYKDSSDTTGTTIIISNVNNGIAYNSMPTYVDVDGDMTTSWLSSQVTSGGRNGDACYTVNLDDVVSEPCSVDSFPNWLDGVYCLTYIVYDQNGIEIARKTKKFFIDCNAKNCLKTLIKTLLDDCKDCDEADPRIVMLRSKLDAARNQFDECLYDCAQETIESVSKQCRNFCLDCD